jgi:spermidine synthase
MPDPPKIHRSHSAALVAVFFLSGASALICQVAWIRWFGFTFGVTVRAMGTVLAAFMAGLALGSLVFGRAADRSRNPAALLLFLEIGIGVFAAAFPWLFKGFTAMYLAVHERLDPVSAADPWLRFLLGFLFLLVPATLMGGTLPVVSRLYVRRMSTLGKSVGILHGANQAGAVAGCLACGWVLIAAFGLSAAGWVAAALNGLAAFLLLPFLGKNAYPVRTAWDEGTAGAPEGRNIHGSSSAPPVPVPLLLAVFGAQGFTTLAYEVVWTRILAVLSHDKGAYFTSTVIAAFIFGLSVGSFAIAKKIDRTKNPLSLLAAIEGILGIFGILILPVFSSLFEPFTAARLSYSEHWWTTVGKENGLFFILIAVPAVFMGMTFPLVARLVTDRLADLGRKIGVLGFWDTVGSAAGSAAAAFILVPALGAAGAGIAVAGLNLLLFTVLVMADRNRSPGWRAAAPFAAVLVLAAGLVFIPRGRYFRFWDTRQPGDRLLFYSEDEGAAVAVIEHLDGMKDLAINGAVTAFAEYGDLRVHRMLAALPMLLHPAPRNALVIGLGMGVTARTLLQPGMESVESVEISSGVVGACGAAFRRENRDVLSDPRLRVILDDGRNRLLTSRKRYDIITSNAVHARLSGNLYTEEFYRLCRNRLAPGGVMCQWMSTNWCTEDEYRMLLKAFFNVFPDGSLWSVDAGNVLCIGALTPAKPDFWEWSGRMSAPELAAELRSVDLRFPIDILSQYAGSAESLAGYLNGVRPETDGRPLAEFSRVVSKARNPMLIQRLIEQRAAVEHPPFTWKGTDRLPDTLASRWRARFESESLCLRATLENVFLNRPGEAAASLEQAARLVPGEYRFHELLALLRIRLGDTARTEAELIKALALHPEFAIDWIHLGMVRYDTGRTDPAAEAFNRAHSVSPDHPLALYYLGLIAGARGELSTAAGRLERVTYLFPDFADAYLNLGLAYRSMGQNARADSAFRRCLGIDPGNREAERLVSGAR